MWNVKEIERSECKERIRDWEIKLNVSCLESGGGWVYLEKIIISNPTTTG